MTIYIYSLSPHYYKTINTQFFPTNIKKWNFHFIPLRTVVIFTSTCRFYHLKTFFSNTLQIFYFQLHALFNTLSNFDSLCVAVLGFPTAFQ